MAEAEETRKLIVGRAVEGGVLAGGATGLVIGTVTFPIVGTCLGAAFGATVGAGLGLLNGAVLSVLSRWTGSRLVYAAAAGLVCGVGAVAGAALAYGGWQRLPTSGWQPPAFVVWCVGLGVVLGPLVVRSSGRSGGGPDLTRVALFAGYGAAAAAIVGAVVGLVVGLVAYPPTAPFALIEGSLLAGPSGALLGALAALIATRRRRTVQ